MLLSRFPRVRLAHTPTPLEPLPRLTALLQGPQLWIKRDDCTGLAIGGNKARKLEFLLGEALSQKADTLIAQGAVQSNHVRQTAAAAARLGLKCEILLEDRVPDADPSYYQTGNLFLSHLLGGQTHLYPSDTDMEGAMQTVAQQVRSAGGIPYIIPGGGSNPTGALGYVAFAQEFLYQAGEQNLRVDWLVHATGSSGTQAGLVAGLQGLNSGIPILGISVRRNQSSQVEKVLQLALASAERLNLQQPINRNDILVSDEYVGQGYGYPTPATLEAISLLAQTEGILLDPIYTGKAMAGLIDLIRKGFFQSTDNVVFLHTGGSPGLFAYESDFSAKNLSPGRFSS
ncbi:MAG: D-cysteine desulfhydrase [Cyanobacteriota bacterium]|nr:D-cysteine desulfhydrase [Cyanobacteriota bacterium]